MAIFLHRRCAAVPSWFCPVKCPCAPFLPPPPPPHALLPGLFSNATHYIIKSNDIDEFDMESVARMGYLYAHGDTRTFERLRVNIQLGKPIVMLHNSGGVVTAFSWLQRVMAFTRPPPDAVRARHGGAQRNQRPALLSPLPPHAMPLLSSPLLHSPCRCPAIALMPTCPHLCSYVAHLCLAHSSRSCEAL